MSLPESVTSAFNWVWSEVQPAATFLYNTGSSLAIGANSFISGTCVQTVASVWATLGPTAAPITLALGIAGTALLGRYLWRDLSCTSAIGRLVERILGITLVATAAIATVALVGYSSGVGVAAYAIGAAVGVVPLIF
jgi:hypothetical protein